MASLRSAREMGREKWESTSGRERVGLPGKAAENCLANLDSLQNKH